MQKIVKKPREVVVIVSCLLLGLVMLSMLTDKSENPTGIITVPALFMLLPLSAIWVYRYIFGKK